MRELPTPTMPLSLLTQRTQQLARTNPAKMPQVNSLGNAPDLRSAFFGALAVPRQEARARALEFGWAQSARQFVNNLVPAHENTIRPRFVTRLS